MERQRIFWVVLTVTIFVVIVLVAGVYLLRQKPQAAATPSGTITPITGPGTQIFEYSPEKPQTQTGAGTEQQKPGEPQTMHFYIGEGAEKPPAPPQPVQPTEKPPVPPAPQPQAQVPQAQQPKPQPPVQPPQKIVQAPVAPAHPRVVAAAPRRTTAPVKVAAKPHPLHREVDYWIQTGSYKSQSKAEELIATLADKGLAGKVFSYEAPAGTFYRVRIGPYTNPGEATKFLSIVKQIQGLEASFVSQVGGVRNFN